MNTHRSLIYALDIVPVGAGYQFNNVLVTVFCAPVQSRLQHEERRGSDNSFVGRLKSRDDEDARAMGT